MPGIFTVALGWTIGGHDLRIVTALNFMAQAAGVLLLGLGASPVLLLLGCILFGLGVGNLFSLPPLIAQAEFESADASTVVALVTAVNQTVFGLAPAVFGVLHDATVGYAVPFALAWTFQIAAATVVVGGARHPRRKKKVITVSRRKK